MIKPTSPLVLDLSQIKEGHSQSFDQEGPAPYRLGLGVIGIPEGDIISVHATAEHQGEAYLLHCELEGTLKATCAQCGEDFTEALHRSFTTYALEDEDTVDTDPDEDTLIVDTRGHVDLAQFIIDELGTTLPFAPHCGCEPQATNVEDTPDPRWSGLEKFL